MSRNNAGLSAERIITEALRIIDGQGLRRLTMRRLGDALEVEAMAIYHHFPLGKEQLFDAIVAHITDVTPRPGDGDTDADTDTDATDPEASEDTTHAEVIDDRPWDERLRSWAHDYRTALLRHHGALTLLINRRPDTAAARRSLDVHYAAFEEAGLRGPDIVRAATVLDSYVTGAVIHEVRERGLAAPQPAAIDGRYPHVAALRDVELDPDRRFAEGLETVLDGLTAQHG